MIHVRILARPCCSWRSFSSAKAADGDAQNTQKAGGLALNVRDSAPCPPRPPPAHPLPTPSSTRSAASSHRKKNQEEKREQGRTDSTSDMEEVKNQVRLFRTRARACVYVCVCERESVVPPSLPVNRSGSAAPPADGAAGRAAASQQLHGASDLGGSGWGWGWVEGDGVCLLLRCMFIEIYGPEQILSAAGSLSGYLSADRVQEPV